MGAPAHPSFAARTAIEGSRGQGSRPSVHRAAAFETAPSELDAPAMSAACPPPGRSPGTTATLYGNTYHAPVGIAAAAEPGANSLPLLGLAMTAYSEVLHTKGGNAHRSQLPRPRGRGEDRTGGRASQ